MPFEDDDHVSRDKDTTPRARILPFGPRRAPDWLTGPGDDLGAVLDPEAPAAESPAMPAAVLTRPGLPAPAQVAMEPGIEPTSASVFAAPPEPPAQAEPAASAAPLPIEPRRPKPRRVPDPSAPWAPAASSVPLLRLSLVEKPGSEPPQEEVPAAAARPPGPGALPGREDDLRQAPVAPAEMPPLVESWWVVALDNFRANRRAQLAAAGVLVAVVALAAWMWPRGVGTTPLSQIRRHPARFDGREVVVRGRVGDDVFAVGAGWAFYLMQGRDTIVAFSLSRQPEPRRVLTLKGQVSTGFLDGMPRQALFEGGAPLP